MHRRIIPVIIVVLLASAAFFIWRNNNVKAQAGHGLLFSGNIEVDDAALSFQVPGRIIERPVQEGELLSAGQLVARLDSIEFEQQVLLRQGELAVAEAQLAELEAGSRPEQVNAAAARVNQAQAQLEELQQGSRSQEIERAAAAVEQAEADLARADAEVELRAAELERYSTLYNEGVIAAQQYDSVETAHTVALRSREAARTRVDSAEQSLSLLEEGPRSEQIDQARAFLNQASAQYQEVANGPRPQTVEQAKARVEIARQALALAETQLARTELLAPASGIVLSKSLEAGEYAQPGVPVVSIGNLEQVYLRAYVPETELGRISIGQQLEVSVDSLPGKTFKGTVSFIASEAEFTPKTVQTFEERVKLVYRIKILVDNPELELKPGMPADARLPEAAH